LDDIWIYIPEQDQPYRSIKQLMRSYMQTTNPCHK
jgi:hypothetical protein